MQDTDHINSDKKTGDPTFYVDVKSEELRDILRVILRDVRGVSLNEDKPAANALPPPF
jgi:hypothetical protein